MKKLFKISFIVIILLWNTVISVLAVVYYETLENRMKVLADSLYVDITERDFKRKEGLPYHGYEHITFEVNDAINKYWYYCTKQIKENK